MQLWQVADEANFSQQNTLILKKGVWLEKVVNFKDFWRPNKEIKNFSRTSTEFKDLSRWLVDSEQSLFFFRFSESNARARERRSRETRETRAAARERASPVSRHQSRAWPLRVSRFARRTTEKKETARSLDD